MPAASAAAIWPMGRPEVLVVSTACGARCGTTLRQQRGLDLEIFGHGLDDPVARGDFGQVVVEGAGSDERGAARARKSAAGLDLGSASRATRRGGCGSLLLAGPRSRSSMGIPALARWAAMREPMVPAPSTAARRTSSGCEVRFRSMPAGSEKVAAELIASPARVRWGIASGVGVYRGIVSMRRSSGRTAGSIRKPGAPGQGGRLERMTSASVQMPKGLGWHQSARRRAGSESANPSV